MDDTAETCGHEFSLSGVGYGCERAPNPIDDGSNIPKAPTGTPPRSTPISPKAPRNTRARATRTSSLGARMKPARDRTGTSPGATSLTSPTGPMAPIRRGHDRSWPGLTARIRRSSLSPASRAAARGIFHAGRSIRPEVPGAPHRNAWPISGDTAPRRSVLRNGSLRWTPGRNSQAASIFRSRDLRLARS